MIRLWSIGFLLCLAYQPAWANAPQNAAFNRLLNEAGMVYESNRAFIETKLISNSRLAFEKAIEHSDSLLEVRYVIRPLKGIKIDYDDPHASAPNPNHLFPLLFDSVANRIAGEGYRSKREFPANEAKRLFNAEWAAATAFNVHPQFSAEYKQGILIAMHKNKLADAYVIFLYNDYPKAKALLEEMQTSLRFGP